MNEIILKLLHINEKKCHVSGFLLSVDIAGTMNPKAACSRVTTYHRPLWIHRELLYNVNVPAF